MPTVQRVVGQSVSLPSAVAPRVNSLAKSNRTRGLETREQKKKHFLDLVDQLVEARDSEVQSRLKEELARWTFGE